MNECQSHSSPARPRIRTTVLDSSGEQTADTFKWDTVFAIRTSDVNAAIVKAGSSPAGFMATDTVDQIDGAGSFGPWQIVSGGTGDLIRLGMRFHDMTLSGPGLPAGRFSGSVAVDVNLAFLHKQDAQPANGTIHELRISATPTGTKPVASVAQPKFDGVDPGLLVSSAALAIFDIWFNSHLHEFDHVFATVNLDRLASSGAFQWMQPTDVSYAYVDHPNGDGILGVLCMTGGRSSDGLAQQISAAAIPDGSRAGFLISKDLIMEKLLLPIMPQCFATTTAADFRLSDSGDAIVHAHDNVQFTFTDKDGNSRTASVTNLNMTISGEELRMDVSTSTTVSPGIQALCDTTNFLGIQLVNRASGGQTLSFFDRRPAVNNHSVEHGSLDLTEKILFAIGIIAAAIFAIATDGVAIGAVALDILILVGITEGGIQISETIISQVSGNDAPEIGAFVLDATAPIVWPQSSGFPLDNVGLSDSLRLGGTPHFD